MEEDEDSERGVKVKEGVTEGKMLQYLGSVVTAKDIANALEKGDVGSEPGEDEVGYAVLKLLGKAGKDELAAQGTEALETGYWPTEWRGAVQSPSHKEGDKSNPKNYRALSLLSCTGKAMEQVLNTRIQDMLQFRGALDDTQN